MRFGVTWITALSLSAPAFAGAVSASDLDFHGFVSQGAVKTTDNNYLARSKRGSVEFSEAALNLRASFGDDLTVGMQLFARDLGPLGNYNAKFDWYYLDWHPRDWAGLRAGRIRVPFGLYNESADYDPGRTVILLPQSLYPTTSRDFLLGVTGGELYGTLDLGGAGLVAYNAYYGTLFFDPSDSAQPTTINVPYATGGRLFWETPIDKLRIGGSVLALRLTGNLGSTAPVAFRLPAVLWVGSAAYAFGPVRFTAEYGRWHVEIESSDRQLLPCGTHSEDDGAGCTSATESERYYAMATVELTAWMQAAAYYSALFVDTRQRQGRENYQHDVAATLRFDILENWLVKIEGHYMQGTAALNSGLNGKALAELTRDWGLLLVKTTAYF